MTDVMERVEATPAYYTNQIEMTNQIDGGTMKGKTMSNKTMKPSALKLVTAESVRRGHPDKFCDQIADAILDAHLRQDANARVAVEVFATAGKILIAGEVTSKAEVCYPKIVERLIDEIGYDTVDLCKEGTDELEIEVLIHDQSEDISQAVGGQASGNRQATVSEQAMLNKHAAVGGQSSSPQETFGAGDQGIMVGYATDETKECLPLPVVLAHRLCRALDAYRADWLGADGKVQVTVAYDGNTPLYVHTVVIAVQHAAWKIVAEIRLELACILLEKAIPPELFHPETRILINPSGKFVLGGPAADTGLTGRKLAVDEYGPVAHVGGGAHCVDGDTEFLTPHGWKRISEYAPDDEVAQWDADNLSFVLPDQYIKTPAKNMYHITSPQSLDMVLSENHDMVLLTSKGNVIKKRVKDFLPNGKVKNGNFGVIPTSFSYMGDGRSVPLSDDEIRLQVAFCADGTLCQRHNTPRIRIKRERKKDRLERLLALTETAYRRSEDHEYSIYYFNPPLLTKRLSEYFWNASPHQLKVIAEEAVLWDGDAQSQTYRTTIKDDADFMQFAMMVATGMNVSISVDQRIGELYQGKYIRKSILYSVFTKKSSGVSFRYGHSEKLRLDVKPYQSVDTFMYCFCVPSGMLVLRRNGKVFVTGNSGKDATKVDRSGAYMARYVAKNIVAAGLAKRCEVQLSYAIGRAKPVSVSIDTFGTGALPEAKLAKAVRRIFDLTPAGMIRTLELCRPIYEQTAVYGHFGKPGLPWERTDKTTELILLCCDMA